MRLFKIFTALLLLPLSVMAASSVWTGKVAEKFASGKGEPIDPYVIETAEQFALMAQQCHLGEYFRLDADIVLNEGDAKDWAKNAPKNTWKVPCDTTNPARLYLDGGGHSISGLYINSKLDYRGLFGVLFGGVQDLVIKNAYVKGGSTVGTLAGAYVSDSLVLSRNIIQNVSVEDAIVEGVDMVGGLVGTAGMVWKTGVPPHNYNYTVSRHSIIGPSIIRDVSVTGSVSGQEVVGGIVGLWRVGDAFPNRGAAAAKILNVVNRASVKGSVHVGGIFAYLFKDWSNNDYYVAFTNAINYGDIEGDSIVAGITPKLSMIEYEGTPISEESSGILKNFANLGNVTARTAVCGLISALSSGTKYGYNAGKVTGDSTAVCYSAGHHFYDLHEEHADSILQYADSLGACFIPDTGKTLYNKGYPLIAYWHKDKVFDDGSGTEDDPFLIKNLHDLRRFEHHAEYDFDRGDEYVYYRQEADIELPKTENNWVPVNVELVDYNGGGHSISNLNITDSNINLDSIFEVSEKIKGVESFVNARSYRSDIGFFGKVARSRIHDFSLLDVDILGGSRVGALWSGNGYGFFSGISVSGSVKGVYRVGGLAGYDPVHTANFLNVTNYADVRGFEDVCGIGNGDIKFARNYGSVTGISGVGGILTSLYDNEVSYVYNMGPVSGQKTVGGLAAGTVKQWSLSHGYNAASVTGEENVGAIIGILQKGDSIVGPLLYDNILSATAFGVDSLVVDSVFGMDTKTMKSNTALDKLGIVFKADVENKNDGYPVFALFKEKGTEDSPFLIRNAQELKALSLVTNSANEAGNPLDVVNFRTKYFKITADIDLKTSEKDPWIPLFSQSKSMYEFFGTIDGDGHVISGIYSDSLKYSGLVAANFGTIKNLGIANSTIRGQTAGAIAGINYGIIENCWNENAPVRGVTVGGIVGIFALSSDSKVTDAGIRKTVRRKIYMDRVYNAGDVTGSSKAGGIAGEMNASALVANAFPDMRNAISLANSYNVGKVTFRYTNDIAAASARVGGIVADVSGTAGLTDRMFTMKNLYNTFDVCASKPKAWCRLTFSGVKNSIYVKNVFYMGETQEDTFGEAKSSKEMKSKEFAALLGDAFAYDSKNVNNGYPVLSGTKTFSPDVFDPDQPLGIEKVPLVFRALQVSVTGREIRLDNMIENVNTVLFDLRGKRVWNGAGKSAVIPVQKAGVYIVRNRFQMAKIVVR